MRGRAEKGGPFALLLLDAQMPGMDGFALAREIQRDPMLAGPRIMMLSSLDLRSLQPDLRESGHYLTKPVTRDNLFKAILNVLGSIPEAPASEQRASRPAARRPLRVLLAEDNAINQKVAARLVEKQGHSVVLASDGAEALAAFERQPFDVVLMDVQMPVMNGYAATQAIRQRERATGTHIPIVALTAHAMKGDREICLNSGMDSYLSKPIQVQELAAVLNGVAQPGEVAPISPRQAS
jgi:CheY-like chemotaxis protein